MKKLIIKIFAMMAVAMLIVLGISRLALHIMQKSNIFNATLSYHISLIAGFVGLVVFAVLLYVGLVRRLQKITHAVKTVADGNLDVNVNVKGNDELAQLADNFKQMTQGLQSNQYLSREFVKNVSHEFKTPVSIIIGYSQLLQSDNITQAERQEYSGIILQQAQFLNRLSVNLLQVSRLDSNALLPTKQQFDVDEQIRNIVLSMQSMWQQKQLDVVADLPMVKIVGHSELCFMVWQNLIANAVKYTQVGGQINIDLNRVDDKLVFAITNSDTRLKGKENLAFEPFYTESSQNESKGTGLGLPLVKKIVQKLSGEVHLTVDDNTKFVVELPVEFC